MVRRIGPSLDALVAKHGGYEKIPFEAWEAHDSEVKAWQLARHYGDFYLTSQQEADDDERKRATDGGY